MPSTKTIAVAVAALAASGVSANKCNPSACTTYDLKTESEIEAEELNCNKRGAFKDTDSYSLPSWSMYDCAKSCYDYEQFTCQQFSFTPGEEAGIQGLCTLYPDNEIPGNIRGPLAYYDKKCFKCSPPPSRGGRGGAKIRGRIRRS
ncbi:unnamed protein product [Fusarium graminearum]|uniref:Apple domain-containing protein n=1 Tax=Gibberella zeae TaxID=5518 RepID=A0A2H3G768_GIBZA|nr:hypothetical protein FGRA07_05041 [Fusarium graminearum]CAF3446809.1 unnamed protein product [Fusarium graminearum]CAG1959301.1 unnamed protein product [Fusarium graminearum]CAG1962734.1 unnamed protein product [Fusarium graminearum]CAG1974920.1 unnamed protein product [Fusarium graminearum]